MESRSERVLTLARMHAYARQSARRSQEFMALELGVSKKTIQNWEKGVSSPTFFQSLEWFRVLSINPFPYFLAYLFPDEFQNLTGADSDEKINTAFDILVKQLPSSTRRALLYIFYGNHGSSPNAILQLFLAYLHTPLVYRLTQATLTKNIYEMEKSLGEIICPDNILPNMDVLNTAMQNARVAALSHEYGYSFVENTKKN